MLTVVFATRNRARMLGRVLESFAALEAPPGRWKLLVVDNGSVDDTPAVLAGWLHRLPLTILAAATPGKNRALNAALAHLEGDLAVFTDDDVLPSPDWLPALRAAADQQPNATMFGGTVMPCWPGPLPHWLAADAVPFSVLYAQQMRPCGPCGFDAIFGPNMAIRRSVFDDGLRFSEAVGPDATNRFYAMGSETELLRRLQALGHRGWFEPAARVEHIVRPEQIEERWILDRAYRYGIGEGRNSTEARQGLPAALLARVVAYRAAALAARLFPPSRLRLRLRYRDRFLAGVVAGTLAEARANPGAGAAGVAEKPLPLSALP